MVSLFRPADGALPYTAAFAYSVAANAAGLALILQVSGALPPPPTHPGLVGLAGVLLSAHGRIVASYLVHELAHSSVFKARKLNTAFGILCTWLCVRGAARGPVSERLHGLVPPDSLRSSGSPYCSFNHVRTLHIAHHYDRAGEGPFWGAAGLGLWPRRQRVVGLWQAPPLAPHRCVAADTGDFDYRAFVKTNKLLTAVVVFLENHFVPAVEFISHARVALAVFSPEPVGLDRRAHSAVGLTALLAFTASLYSAGGALAVFLCFCATNIVFHVLNFHDAFQVSREGAQPILLCLQLETAAHAPRSLAE